MHYSIRKPVLALVAMSLVLTMAGCASSSSTRAKSLKSSGVGAANLSECLNITVAPFTVAANRSVNASMGANFANDIKNRLRNDFGPLFASVELSTAARGVERECLVKGHISRYEPGNRAARFLLIGLGAAHFEGTVDVVDVAGQRALISAPFDKLWAWGGILGASKGIDGMIDEASASVAATLARAKGWTPESGK